MKQMRRLTIVSGLLLSVLFGNAQINVNEEGRQTTALYNNAVTLLRQNRLFEANAEFEKVIKASPNHKDALYNLAVINDKLGDSPTAIRFLLQGVKLDDKNAARLLVNKFGYKLSYADTMQNISVSTQEKYMQLDSMPVSSLDELIGRIRLQSSGKREQLQLLLLWVHDNMRADSKRFFEGGNPLTTSEAFARRTGLCDEYANIMAEFCKAAGIPHFKVAGYVKYESFKAGDVFTQANHAWNAVYLESSWVLCDLFWSTAAMTADQLSPRFVKRLEPKYFLGIPGEFIKDHLPIDPIFQFLKTPFTMTSFTRKTDSIDTTIVKLPFLNFLDSLTLFSKMKTDERQLKIAQHAYAFNKDNPNDMIVESYNYAVEILNKKTPPRQELLRAKKSLTMALGAIDTSTNEEIRSLKDNCKTGIAMIDTRLAKPPARK